jgi:hypothetical protein
MNSMTLAVFFLKKKQKKKKQQKTKKQQQFTADTVAKDRVLR